MDPPTRYPSPGVSPAHSPHSAQRAVAGSGTGGLPRLHVEMPPPPRHPHSGASRALLASSNHAVDTHGPSTHEERRPSLVEGVMSPRAAQVHQSEGGDVAVSAVGGGASSMPSLDRVSLKGDLRVLLRLALPSSAIFLVQFLVNFSSVIFVGRLGPEYLGAAALANMLSNLTGFSIGNGATTALDALCSQAFGARSFLLVGRHTQRAMVCLSLACVPVAFIWWRTDTILGWMGVEPLICDLAGHYTRWLILGMWPTFMSECLRRYLQSTGTLWPIVVAAVLTALSSLLLNLAFQHAGLAFAGPAIASALCNWVLLLSIVACMWGARMWKRCRRARRMGGGTYSSVVRMESQQQQKPSGMASPGMDEMSSPVVRMSPPPHAPSPAAGWGSPAPSPSLSPTMEVEFAQLKQRQVQGLRGGEVEQEEEEEGEREMEEQRMQLHKPVPSAMSTQSSPDAPPLHVSKSLAHAAPLASADLSDPDETWPSPWSVDVLRGWTEFLRLAIPGALSVFVEWGSYEVSASMAARLGANNLAVHAIFMNTASMFYMVPLGVATACSITIGQMLGAGRGDRARDFARIGLALNAVYPVLTSLVLVLGCRGLWGRMFTDDEAVAHTTARVLPVMFLYFFMDHVKCMCMAVLRGCGRAPITVYGNTLSCWLVGFPLAYVLVFNPFRLELWGLWVSMSMAWATACVLYTIVIARTDWAKEVQDAHDRMERSKGGVPIAAVADPKIEEEEGPKQPLGASTASTAPSSPCCGSTDGAESNGPAVKFTIHDDGHHGLDASMDLEEDEEEEEAESQLRKKKQHAMKSSRGRYRYEEVGVLAEHESHPHRDPSFDVTLSALDDKSSKDGGDELCDVQLKDISSPFSFSSSRDRSGTDSNKST